MKRWMLAAQILIAATVLAVVVVIAFGLLPYRVFVVHTGSMTPTIPSTSAVIVKENQYHVGQVISFHEQGGVITHRLIHINADGTIVTKGDANPTVDPWHPPTSAIIGGVVAAPDHVGYWIIYLRNPLGIASLGLGLLACWLIWSVFVTEESDPPEPLDDRGGRLDPVSVPSHLDDHV